MKVRKLLFGSLFVILIGSTTNSNAGIFDAYYNYIYGVVIDTQGRRLDNHEDNGISKPWAQRLGHTIKSHVEKDNYYLAKRCEDFKKRGMNTRYASTYKDIRVAAKIIRNGIKLNKRQFDSSLSRAGENRNFVLTGRPMLKTNGHAVDCKAFSASYLVKIPSLGLYKYWGPSGSYQTKSKIIIKKRRNQPGGWFVLTSFPDK